MLTRREYIKILIFIFVIGIIIAIQLLLADFLSQISIPIIISLQKDQYLVTSMKFMTMFGTKIVKLLLLIICYATCNHYHAFMYSLVTYTSMLACIFLKINLQQPRPFWISDSIQAIECEYDYGYPSNHVLTTVPALLIFFEIQYYRYEIDKTMNKRIYYWIGMSTLFFICIMVGFSRLVLGVHSLDQVVFGLIMGFAFYYFFLDIIDFDLKTPTPFFRILFNSYNFYKLVFIFSTAILLFFVNSIIVNDNYDDEWTDRIIKGCGYMPYLTPFFTCFSDFCDISILIGIFAGIIYEVKVNGNFFNYEEYIDEFITYKNHNRIGKWNDTNFIISLIRVIVSFIENIFLLKIFKFIFSIFNEGLISHLIFTKILPLTLIGFVMFAFYKKQFELFKLTNKENNSI